MAEEPVSAYRYDSASPTPSPIFAVGSAAIASSTPEPEPFVTELTIPHPYTLIDDALNVVSGNDALLEITFEARVPSHTGRVVSLYLVTSAYVELNVAAVIDEFGATEAEYGANAHVVCLTASRIPTSSMYAMPCAVIRFGPIDGAPPFSRTSKCPPKNARSWLWMRESASAKCCWIGFIAVTIF